MGPFGEKRRRRHICGRMAVTSRCALQSMPPGEWSMEWSMANGALGPAEGSCPAEPSVAQAWRMEHVRRPGASIAFVSKKPRSQGANGCRMCCQAYSA